MHKISLKHKHFYTHNQENIKSQKIPTRPYKISKTPNKSLKN